MNEKFLKISLPRGSVSFEIDDYTGKINKTLIEQGYINGVYWYIPPEPMAVGTLLARHRSGEFHSIDLTHDEECFPLEIEEEYPFEDYIEEKYDNLKSVCSSTNKDDQKMGKLYKTLLSK